MGSLVFGEPTSESSRNGASEVAKLNHEAETVRGVLEGVDLVDDVVSGGSPFEGVALWSVIANAEPDCG